MRMIPPLWRRQQQVLITMIIIMHPIARMARRPLVTARRWPETIRMMLHRKRNQPEGAGQRRRDNDEHRLGRGRYLSFHRANGCRWGHNSVDAVAPAVPPRQLLPRRPPWLLHHPRLCNYRYHPWPCYNLPRCGDNDNGRVHRRPVALAYYYYGLTTPVAALFGSSSYGTFLTRHASITSRQCRIVHGYECHGNGPSLWIFNGYILIMPTTPTIPNNNNDGGSNTPSADYHAAVVPWYDNNNMYVPRRK